ncbi:MAG: hypothetical protein BGO55_10855 [Sphingobacteriales bacterium 50-39]|nr:fasciclin domain-containing protein [Sphingobacteriales bacterium]OJW54204.1 MAG: hypothetical protein BGO55_10855 [Sphingobacteriales bacterium 50-39]
MYTLFRRYFLGGLLLLCVWLWAACSKSNSGNGAAVTRVDATVQPLRFMLDNNSAFSNFDTLMKVSGYMDSLGKGRSYTLLVPDNTAFINAGIGIDSLLALPKDSLRLFVGNHILPGVVTTDLVPQTITNPLTAVNGQTLYLSKPLISSYVYQYPDLLRQYQHTLHVNGIKVTLTDQKAVDGILHTLHFPLRLTVPSVARYLLSQPQYSLYVAGLRKFNLFDQLDSAGPFTIFPCPNDAMIAYGMTLDRINSDTFDLEHYTPWLFTSGILDSRTFMSDFTDAQLPNNNTGYTRYGTMQYGYGDYGQADPIMSIQITNYTSPLGPNYSIYNNIGPTANSHLKDQQPALNGVIMPLDKILVYPDSVYITH